MKVLYEPLIFSTVENNLVAFYSLIYHCFNFLLTLLSLLSAAKESVVILP